MRCRPRHWQPPGPRPPAPAHPDLRPGPDETLDCLAGHWKIFQLRHGHRYSTDDLLTAWTASRGMLAAGTENGTLLDLGCGIGSVGLLLLWRFPGLRLTGVEAQPRSTSLARRSARFNGVAARCTIHDGDLREFRLDGGCGVDWVTGSPPYLTPAEGRRSDRPQRGPCRFEDRGGVEAYLQAASRLGRPGAGVSWVHADRYLDQNIAATIASGLGRVRHRSVLFREGRDSLIRLFEAKVGEPWSVAEDTPLVVRTASGEWSAEYREVRRDMGFPS
ncbi:MAG TPA: methyltransferase [Deferrisomatales bacterium]|nr:methyltransferase [Deferrisomatales bacterium]